MLQSTHLFHAPKTLRPKAISISLTLFSPSNTQHSSNNSPSRPISAYVRNQPHAPKSTKVGCGCKQTPLHQQCHQSTACCGSSIGLVASVANRIWIVFVPLRIGGVPLAVVRLHQVHGQVHAISDLDQDAPCDCISTRYDCSEIINRKNLLVAIGPTIRPTNTKSRAKYRTEKRMTRLRRSLVCLAV